MFADRTGPLDPVLEPAADRQQFLGESQWLDAAAEAGGRDDAPHGQSPIVAGAMAACTAFSNARTRWSAVCSARVRARAASAMRRNSASPRLMAAMASPVPPATSS